MEPSHSMCVICRKKGPEKVKSFTEDTLKKCHDVIIMRRKKKFKYHDVILPSEVGSNGYHRSCYKMFTAINKKYFDGEITSLNYASTSFQVSHDDDLNLDMSESKCIVTKEDERVCFFCNKKRKKHRGQDQPLHIAQKGTFLDFIKKFANQDPFLSKRFEDSNGDTIFYHASCRLMSYNKVKSSQESTTETYWHKSRNFHKMAYEEICEFIKENIILHGYSYFLSYLHRFYIDLLEKIAENTMETFDHTSKQNLEAKILKTFGKSIKLIYKNNKKIIAPKNVFHVDEKSLNESEILQKAAFVLRNYVLNMEKKLLAGRCSIPREFTNFFTSLIGFDHKQNTNCVKSLSQDVIFAVSNGKIKTSKHINLGLILKESPDQNIIDLINQYGHCCSSNEIKEMKDAYRPSNQTNLNFEKIIFPDIYIKFPFDNVDNPISPKTCQNNDIVKCEDEDTILHQEIQIKCETEETIEQIDVQQNENGLHTVSVKEECVSEDENDVRVRTIEQVFVPQIFEDSLGNEMGSSENSSSIFIKNEPEDYCANKTSDEINVEDIEQNAKINEYNSSYFENDNAFDSENYPIGMKEEPVLDTGTPQDGSTSQAEVDTDPELKKIKVNVSETNESVKIKPYGCGICMKYFVQSGDLAKHMRMHSNERPYECCTCKKRFNKKSHLNIHMRKHSGERPYECNQCKKAFFQKNDLTSHMLTHSGEKPYECEICKMKFSRKNNKTKHLLLHSGEKPHECEICKKSFFEKSNLRKHMIIHSGENPYECEICKVKFNRNYNLATHMLTHFTEKSFECDICKRTFQREFAFKNHIKSHMESSKLK